MAAVAHAQRNPGEAAAVVAPRLPAVSRQEVATAARMIRMSRMPPMTRIATANRAKARTWVHNFAPHPITPDPAMDKNSNPIPCAPASTAWPSADAAVLAADAAPADPGAARVALLAGAFGRVGRAILQGLTTDKRYQAVHSLGHRRLDIRSPRSMLWSGPMQSAGR